MLTACKSCRLSFLLAGFSLAQKSWGFGTEEFSVDFLVHFHLYYREAHIVGDGSDRHHQIPARLRLILPQTDGRILAQDGNGVTMRWSSKPRPALPERSTITASRRARLSIDSRADGFTSWWINELMG